MQMRHARDDTCCPSPAAAADIRADAALRRQRRPGKNVKVVVEYLLALLGTQFALALAKRGPFSAEPIGDGGVEVSFATLFQDSLVRYRFSRRGAGRAFEASEDVHRRER